MMSVVEERKKSFKPVLDEQHGRRSRQETSVQIRKSKKEERLWSRRRGVVAPNPDTGAGQQQKAPSKTYSNNDINELIKVYRRWETNPTSVTNEELLETTKGFRRLLSIEKNPPISEIIQAGTIRFLVKLLQKKDCPETMFEASWALTNIASSKFTKNVASSGAVHILANHLTHDSVNIREQAGWCLGNIAGDSVHYRDALLSMPEVVAGMTRNLTEPANPSLFKNMSWAVSNMCRGKPLPAFDHVRGFIKPSVDILRELENPSFAASFDTKGVDLRTDPVWTLAYLTEGDDERIQAILDAGALPRLMFLVEHFPTNRGLMIPTIRAIGNIVSGNDAQTDAVIEAGFMDHASLFLNYQSKHLRKDLCWLLSNIAAGSENQISALFRDLGGLVKVLVDNVEKAPWEIKKESIWAVCNIITTGTDVHLQRLVSLGGIEALSLALKEIHEPKTLLYALEALKKVLIVNQEKDRNYHLIFDEAGGVENLEGLQEHENNDVYENAVKIIEEFIGFEDEEDQNIVPAACEDGFSFGLNPKRLFPNGQGLPDSSPAITYNFGVTNCNNVPSSQV